MEKSVKPTPATPVKAEGPFRRHRGLIEGFTHAIVLVLSLALIVWISYDTFMDIPYLSNSAYMRFQLWVCLAFQLDFFIELGLSDNRWRHLRRNWFFFLISIPYLNIISYYDLQLSAETLYYLRYIPLLRGAYSLAMVMGFVSKNRAVSLVWQYGAILVTLVYLLAMLFFYQEKGVNPDVHTFWDALYFAAMNTTTVGCSFSAVTPVGKIIAVICPTAGMLMLPLFTVYVVNSVQRFDQANQTIDPHSKHSSTSSQ